MAIDRRALRRAIVVVLPVIALLSLAGCGSSPEEIGRRVQQSMQERFTADPQMSKFGLRVKKVVAIKEAGNKYQGVATIQYKGTERQVPVHITAEGENVIWRTDTGAFMFLMQQELEEALAK